VSPDNGLYVLKHVVSEIIKTTVCVSEKPLNFYAITVDIMVYSCHAFAWECRVSGGLKLHFMTALLYISAVKQLFVVDIDSALQSLRLWMWAVLPTFWT
jgi:hypothetical protein